MPIRVGALLALLLTSSAAFAQECPLPADANPKLGEIDAASRLTFIRESMNHDATNAELWRWSWVSIYALGAVGQLALSPLFPEKSRVDMYVGAGESAIAMLPQLVLPLTVGSHGPKFDAKAAAAKPGDLCSLIAEGEGLMVSDAANEAAGAGWLMQVVNVVYNFAFSAIIGFGFKHPMPAIISGVGGLIIGEAMIFTQPTHLNEAWKQYKWGTFKQEKPTVRFGPAPGSLVAVSGTF
jgi:hypothetical protein